MGWFWGLLRRPRGRHALGAAVTSIPSAPLLRVAPFVVDPSAAAVASQPAPRTPVAPGADPAAPTPFMIAEAPLEPVEHRLAAATRAPVPVPVTPSPVVRRPAPTVAILPLVPAVPASRVQLGFRDGSTASLAAGSEQAVALEALAGLLNRRSS